MESKVVKEYGILKVLEKEGKEYFISLPNCELVRISSAREVNILEKFEILSTVEMGGFIIEAASINGKIYLVAKKEDVLSSRGYDLVGIYSENQEVVMIEGLFFPSIEEIPLQKYSIRGREVCEL
ncbi:MAG: hypothetical protein UR96_C0044G0008 [candidate division WS6 bacterium GW2011_GWC1_36_11]|uniref:Uncharacterized protein n=2 Tax=Candidatus Dojkabacteria TaxID=74243 RepID=A0A0G0DNE6_9BACT|nr:MAG: hypothetical protein UR96_C0044G0008 [candidate division WS6 bacterium GW2011_GWC1_36_11]KKQ12095.1 MAG: hypothetical protein US24_C0005G0002 [candidate division WS6 bacterium GW2011_GWC2_36_7]HAM96490.1 hypothetical protein [Patescibacteria group bacterium]